MHFYPLPCFDDGPLLFEFFHHLFPYEHVLSILLFDSFFRLLLEHVQAEDSLDFGRFLDQEPEVGVSNSCLVHTPVLLDACGSHDRTLNTLVHEFGNFDACCDLVLVLDTVEKLLVAWLAVEVDLRAEAQLSDSATVHVSHLNRGILEKLLNQHEDERDLTPFLQKGPLERLELRGLVQ